MKRMIVRSKTTSLIRITLSFLIFYLQLLLPLNALLAATNSVEPGVVSTPEDQESNQPAELTYIPGDAILLSTYPDTTSFLNGIYPIDDQGYIEFPIGDRIYITNMNEENFLKYLKDNYQNYMRSPNLFVKPMMWVAVVGGFVTPGFYYVDNKMSLWDLIRLAGGPSHEEAIKDINWERNGEKVIDDVTPFLEHGVSLKNMGFKSGD
ncbi:MAG: hypothetical protein KAS58_06605, partial [Calditrichia bacterium]|nr:hypothetical protein [Calditrichia bacterium]